MLKLIAKVTDLTKVELEQAGEETEGMAESTSKLREQVKALTNVTGDGGVDILNGTEDEYRSMYDIFADIAKVWKDMNDMDQAALLELLAGKVRANTVAAMLNNWSQAEAALQTASESAGSALRENERYLDSIEGRLSQLTSTWQSFWNNTLNSDIVKFWVTAADKVMQFADAIGAVPVLVGGISAAIAAINLDRLSVATKDLAKFRDMYNSMRGAGSGIKSAIKGSFNYAAFDASQSNILSSGILKDFSQLKGGIIGQEAVDAMNQYKVVLNDLQTAYSKNDKEAIATTKARAEATKALTNTMKQSILVTESEKDVTAAKALTDGLAAKQALAHAAAETAKKVAISLAVGIAVTAITKLVTKMQEEARVREENLQKVREQAIEEGKNASALLRAAESYQKAKELYQSNPSKETQYRDAVDKVVSVLGEKAEALKDLREESEEYILTLERLIKQEERAAIEQTRSARKAAEEQVTYELGGKNAKRRSVIVDSRRMPSAKGYQSIHQVDDTISFSYDTASMQAVITAYSELSEYLKKWEDRAKKAGEDISRNGSYKRLRSELRELEKSYGEVIQAQINEYEALQREKGQIPQTASEYRKWLDGLYEFNNVTEENKELYESLATTTYPKLAMELQEQERLIKRLKNVRDVEDKDLKTAIKNYNDVRKEMEKLGVTQVDVKFGNINTDDRQVIEWTDQLKKKFKDSIKDWFTEEDAENLVGTISTVLGAWDDAFEGMEGVPIAFSPILQGEHGPELLTKDTVYKYINAVIEKTKTEYGNKMTYDDLIRLDAEGLTIDGKQIKGIIADIGETAEQTAQKMHFTGESGALALAFAELERAAEDAGVSLGDDVVLLGQLLDKVDLTDAEIESLINTLERTGKTTVANSMLEDLDFMNGRVIKSTRDFIKTLNEWIHKQNEIANAGRDFVDQVSAYGEAIDKVQDVISNMSSIIEGAFSGSVDASSYIDTLQTLSEQIADLGEKGESARNELNAMLGGLEFGNLRQLGDLAERVATLQLKKFWDQLEKDGATLPPAIKQAIEQMTILEAKTKGASTGLSNLASAYQTVMSAIAQYNEDGYMTISTLTSILSLGPEYISLLQYEEGQLKLNEDALVNLAKQRIAEAKAALYANAEHQITALIAADESKNMNELARQEYEAAKQGYQLRASAIAAAGGMAQASGEAATYINMLASVEGMLERGAISAETFGKIEDIRKNTESQAAMYDKMLKEITGGASKARDNIMGYTNDAAKNAEDKAKEAADTIKSEIDGIISKWKRALDAGGMSWSQYLRNIDTLSKKYRSQLSEEDYQEYQLQVLEGRKEMYEKAAAAVQNYLSRQKDGLQDQISALDEQTKQIEKQISTIEEKYDDLIKPLEKRSKELEKQKKILEDEIEAIEDGYAETLKPLQKQLQALQDQADAIQAIIDGINAYYDTLVTPLNRRLEELEHIKANLEDALSDINAKYDELVKPYNKQIDNKNTQISALQRIIKERQREIDKIKERYEVEIEANEKIIKSYQKIQKQLQANIKAYEAEIKVIEKRMRPYQDQQEVYNEQIHELEDMQRVNNRAIRDLERLKDAQEQIVNPLQDQLDKLKEANDERNKELELMRARYNLERAMNQRTRRVFTGDNFEYRTDNKAIRDAQDALDKLMGESEISALEEAIKKLQKPISEIDKQIAEIQRKNNLIGFDISDLQDEIHWLDDALEPFEKEIDAVNEKIQGVQDEIDEWGEKIDALSEKNEQLTELMEAELAPIEDVVKGLEKQVELLETEVEKLEAIVAEYEAAREAESEYYNDTLANVNREIELLSRQVREWEYLRTQALRTHEDNLAGINREITALNNQISAIERERDTFTESRKQEVEAIDKVISKISDEISAFEELRDAEKAAFDPILKDLERQKEAIQGQIDALDKYAKGWQDVIDKWERIKEEKLLEDMFGKNWKEMLNAMDPKPLQDFGDKYIRVCQEIADHTAKMAQTIKEAMEKIDKAAKDTASSGSGMGAFSKEIGETDKKAKDFKHTAQELQEDLWKIGKTSNSEKENVKRFGDSIKDITKNQLKSELRNLADDIKKVGDKSGSAAPNVNKLFQNINKKLVDNSGVMRNMASGAGDLDNKVTNSLISRLKDFVGTLGQKIGTSAQSVWNALNNSRSNPPVVTGKLISVRKYEKGGRVEIPTAATGRRITAEDLFSDVARMLGEDTLVAAKVGESILTKRQTDDLEELIQLTPSLIQSTKEFQNIAKIFESEFNRDAFRPEAIQNYVTSAIRQADRTAQGLAASAVHNETNLSFSVGDITIQHAENASDLARQIKQNFPNAALQAFMSSR